MKLRFAITYRINGHERTSVAATDDQVQLRLTLSAVHKCEPRDVDILAVKWASLRTVRTD